MTLPRRFLLGAAGAGPLLWPRAVPALAQTPSATSRTPRDIAVMGMVIDDIVSLDPAEAFEFSGTEIVANCYERLVLPSTVDPTRIEGALAESWETAADGTTTFKMRSGRRFASGNPVTAEDAAFTLERAVILNKAPAFIIRQLGFDKANVAERVTAPDPATLVVRVASPGSPSFLLYCLSAAVGSIVDKRTVMARAQGDDMGNAWLKAGNSAGSGPFILRQWRASENVSLEVNPYSPEPPTLRRLLLLHRPDPSAQLLGLQRGDIDIARTLSPDQLATLGKDQAYTLQPQLKSYLNYIALNQSHPELAKPPVRQAIKWAIDYQGIAKSITPSAYDVHQAFLPRGFPGVLTDQPFRKDPGRARALLAEAGVAKGFAVTLDHASSAPFPDVAQAVQANLAEIGVRVTLVAGEQRQVVTKTRARQHQMAMLRWGPDYLDPHSNAETFCVNADNTEANQNRTLAWRSNWKDDEFTKRAQEALKEPDLARRVALYERLQSDHQERSPFVIMLQQVETAAMRKTTTGARFGLLPDNTRFSQIAIADRTGR